MSEPMSSVEIEDVLSSIRRLVSEDLRPAPRAAMAEAADAADKLILTPALRVVGQDADEPAFDAAPPLAEPVFEAWGAADLSEPEGWAERPDSDAADGGDPDISLEDMEDALAQAAADGAWPSPAADPGSDFQALLDQITQSEAEPEGEVEYTADAASIGAVVSALGAAVTDQGWPGDPDDATLPDPEWSPEEWSDPSGGEVVIDAMDAIDVAEVVAEESGTEARMAAAWVEGEPWEATAPPEDAVDVETAVAVELDSSRDDQAEAEAVAQIVNAAVEDDTLAAAGAAGVGMFDDEDTGLDEEVLRDLVREIIREELQGTLGERITRNVRKLVRMEINRAMASRDFE